MGWPKISVIVTTYNWPSALNRVLSGLFLQSYRDFEVIVADDGSREDTQRVIEYWQTRYPVRLHHCWQTDEGFRASMIRNRAVAMAKYAYLVFLDGDCIPRQHFLKNHARLAQKGWLVKGNRVLLAERFTQHVLKDNISVESWSFNQWCLARWRHHINRLLPLFSLPLGLSRNCFPKEWQGVKTCNLAVWRKDFIEVNGLDENYVGWGFEDSDLVIRLQRKGIGRKSGKFAVGVLHLWHPEQDRKHSAENIARLQKTLQNNQVLAEKGVSQYL